MIEKDNIHDEKNRCKMLKWQPACLIGAGRPKSATIFAGILIAFYLLIASGCAEKEDDVQKDSDVVVDTFTMKEGERLYNKYCVPCHGAEGRGDGIYFTTNLQPGPPDFTDKQFINSRTYEQLFNVIGESPAGEENKGVCPPWGDTLAKEEIDLLITYIRNKFMEVGGLRSKLLYSQ